MPKYFGLTLALSFFISSGTSPVIAAVDAQAQVEGRSSVHGKLKAQDGAAVSGALVEVTDNSGRSFTVSSSADGSFAISGLPVDAPYTLVVEALGFETMRRNVLPGETDLDLALNVDPLQQEITVFAQEELLKTTPEISSTLSSQEVTQLPSVSRSLAQFALLDVRAKNTAGSGSDGRTGTRLSLNNQSFRFTQYLLDGSTNFDFVLSNGPQQNVSLSSVGEFTVQTNTFPAQYGRASGGVVLVATKAGTDQLHGEAFAIVRPSGIQAAPPVSTFHVPNQKLQWGSTIGGPIRRGRTNFLTSYEQLQQERGAFIQSPATGFFTGKLDSYIGLARIDHKWSEHQFTTLRFNGDYLTTNNLNDTVGGFVQASAARTDVQQSFAGQLTQRSLFATWLNDFRISYASALPLWYSPITPSISIVRPSYATTGGSSLEHLRTGAFQIMDTMSKTWKQHQFTFGGDYLHEKAGYNLISTPLGTYTFAAGAPTPGQMPLRYNVTVGNSNLSYGQELMSAHFQDDWKLTTRFTANLGLRYDYQSNASGRTNLQPRLGLAWNPFGDGDTVIRAGAGLFYDQLYGQLQRNALNVGPDATTASYTISNPSYPTPPAVSGAQDRRDIYLLCPTLNNPYTMQLSAGIEQRLLHGFVLEMDAAFLASRHQLILVNQNAPTRFIRTAAGQARTAAAANATRPYLNYRRSDGTTIPVANVQQVSNTGNSRNPSAGVRIRRNFANHFEFQASYLYSSNITNVFFTGGNNTGTPSVSGITAGENGPSDFFQRHRLVAYGVVDLPYAFRLSGTTTAASGLPVNPLTGVDNDGDGIASDRPVGFSRNSFHGALQAQTDLALTRTFSFFEKVRVETRAEFANVFNHNNFVKLTTTYGNTVTPGSTFLLPQAGIQNSDPSRQIQFATRILF
ncbi:MAG: TonB-dependent receptor [Acidobacteriaceae bacterium]|nr:TonB-dependent receptor [Acidobacteriaceae bacterium]